MKLPRLSLVLVMLVSASCYAQCVKPLSLTCQTTSGSCKQTVPAGVIISDSGVEIGGSTVTCCNKVFAGLVKPSSLGCMVVHLNLSNPTVVQNLAEAKKYGPAFFVTCSGDLEAYSAKNLPESQWSATHEIGDLDHAKWKAINTENIGR